MSAKRCLASVYEQQELVPGIFSMWMLCKEISDEAGPGQFLILYCQDQSRKLGRPISICEIDRENGRIRIVYRVAGKGTEEFSKLKCKDVITVLGPLGNGYDILPGRALLTAGGIGIPPMLELAKQLPGEVTVALGYRDGSMFLKEEFEKYAKVVVATEDGSFGTRGTVLDAIQTEGITGDFICACGPKQMLFALQRYAAKKEISAFLSLEEKMACGIGICLGCAVPVRIGDGFTYKRVCKDGPVFNSKEIIFDE
ncbi:Dihydrdoorotate oxidase B%2C electron transfer subunit [uncultured Roseburia sp.]|uniref:Dihydroorotate dehydrogenase B (NAD(+)), electron transfer subunit n=1 Tax=Brotonthovivens ammoniilytica TaxID=2981725 RepID=A0ABT2TKG8_9FIRM|nr:dihydroorotate dehydrogenase electron transfer subunit [Brotonthovivens ammoniilytica]MCU6762326.1 dihydroorotate dehydrogenase electron transfer subunit [Brotonthovivens ammoniilytica]SCI68080.1 Dihydrdoorotate oxidase B%2C electron transfer subunit [uncultured Roseburia sp.]